MLGRNDSLVKECVVWKNFSTIHNYIRQTLKYKPKQVIFSEGDIPLGLYIVKNERVKIESISENGHSHSLRLVGPNGMVGYRSLVNDEPYAASAVALEASELYLIPKHDFMSLIKDHPEIALGMLKQLSDDLKMAESKWATQIDKTAAARIAETLIFLNSHFLKKKWTRKEIADWAGTTTETVIRTLAQFEEQSLIDQSGQHISIKNLHGLQSRGSEFA